jgi:aldose 1-epimerase
MWVAYLSDMGAGQCLAKIISWSDIEMKRIQITFLGAALLMMTVSASAATAKRIPAGTLQDSTPIEAVVLHNGGGVSARVMTYGATLQSLVAPDNAGVPADIVLGHDDVAGYEGKQNYLGVTVGRYANRIAGGKFTLAGKAYQLPLNDGVNTLHGGGQGFDRSVWTINSVTSGAEAAVVMSLHSPDGASGYPGAVDATVTYSLDDHGMLT